MNLKCTVICDIPKQLVKPMGVHPSPRLLATSGPMHLAAAYTWAESEPASLSNLAVDFHRNVWGRFYM